MQNTLEFVKANPLPLSALAYGVYSAGVSVKNLREGQGCKKCETTRLVLGLVLAGVAGYALVSQATRYGASPVVKG